ncbi:MAG: hypothetical protein ABR979_05535 [Halobacteriota archaeon]|jgi:hypothetical protein
MMKIPIYYLEERVRSLDFEDTDNAPTRGTKVYDVRGADEREANLKKEYFGEGAADDLISKVSDCDSASTHLLKGAVSRCRCETKYAQEVPS